MNVVILGVLSTKFATAAGGVLMGFLMLLLVWLLVQRRSIAQLRPLFIGLSLGTSLPTRLLARTDARWLAGMASRAPPPMTPARQWTTTGRLRRE